MATKHELAQVFMDTLKFCEENEKLREAVDKSIANTRVFHENFAEEVEANKSGQVEVQEGRTIKTALEYCKEFPEKKIAVLNFAASQTPGGGVKHGSYAQEESICRSSTLYPSLISSEARKNFYNYHYEAGCGYLASDRCIYSPNVIICRDDSDEIPARLSPEEFKEISVITCAAPHLRDNIIKAEELFNIHVKRAKNILRVAAFNGIDIFIGGAFGCGAFHNNPYIVAWAWREALKTYSKKFDQVIFALYHSPLSTRDPEGNNWRAFRNEFSDEVDYFVHRKLDE